MTQKLYSRRHFVKQAASATSMLPLIQPQTFFTSRKKEANPLKIHIFSKHLHFLNYQEVAEVAAEIGFDGVDLSVRPNGHVEPERVETDLPKAVDALKKRGFSPLLMTTAVSDSQNATDKKVLETAVRLGIRYYRMNWYRYPDNQPMPTAMQTFQQKMKDLSQLNAKLGLTGCYQNHAGEMVGASTWELWELLKEANPQSIGLQYDIRHATVEGGLSWRNGLRLLQPHIKTIVLKDFVWAQKDGKWVVQNTPIGAGMVDFKTYFRLLKNYQVQVPVSLHLEYPLGGADQGARKLTCDQQVVFEAMKKDLATVKELWHQA